MKNMKNMKNMKDMKNMKSMRKLKVEETVNLLFFHAMTSDVWNSWSSSLLRRNRLFLRKSLQHKKRHQNLIFQNQKFFMSGKMILQVN